MSDLYERIVQNYRHPKNSGTLKDADINAKDVNTTCGDEVEIWIRLDGGRIGEIKFNGMACATTLASASLTTEFVKGMTLEDVEKLGNDDIARILGIKMSPNKLKCAVLPLSAIKLGIKRYAGSRKTAP